MLVEFKHQYNRASAVLNDWKICDSTIAYYKSKHPTFEFDSIFIHLKRPDLITNDDYYKSHINELLSRFVNNECLSFATKAEISSFIHKVAITVSLPGNECFKAMVDLFKDMVVIDEDSKELINDCVKCTIEHYDVGSQKIIETLKNKLRVKDRVYLKQTKSQNEQQKLF